MKKIKILKATFVSLILVICIISYIAYSSRNLFPICFNLSGMIAVFLSISLLQIYTPYRDSKPSKTRFLTASAITIVFSFILFGIFVYFFQNYPLSSFSDPFDRFMLIWGMTAFAFSSFTFIILTFARILKK